MSENGAKNDDRFSDGLNEDGTLPILNGAIFVGELHWVDFWLLILTTDFRIERSKVPGQD